MATVAGGVLAMLANGAPEIKRETERHWFLNSALADPSRTGLALR
jgi:hypothetical protein